jgi:hypothetical protein
VSRPDLGTPGNLVLSYLGLRRAVGIIGLALPFVLALGKIVVDGPGLQESISGYYYTSMRDVFVGALCAIGVFFLSYRYRPQDDRLSNLVGVFAIGIALLPTAPVDPTPTQRLVGDLHLGCAAAFFLLLAYFALFLFTRSDAEVLTARKRSRNAVYRVCGTTIVACLVLAVVAHVVLGPAATAVLHPLFWLESVADLAFGVSWLVKGEAILADQPGEPVPAT